jgi:hypothetical protein
LIYDFGTTAGVFRKLGGHAPDRLDNATRDRPFARGVGQRRRVHEADRAQRGAPRAKIIRREVGARRVLQILVDLTGIDRSEVSCVVDILEQPLSRQLMAPPDQLRQPSVVDGDLVIGAAFAAKAKDEPSVANEPDMTIAKRRQSVAFIVARVLGTPCACVASGADDNSQNLFRGRLGSARSAKTERRRGRARQFRHALELLAVKIRHLG